MSPEQWEEYGPGDDDPVDAAEEWTEGQCDNCTGSTAEELKAASEGAFTPVCACAVGQGATDPEACVCGPGGEVS